MNRIPDLQPKDIERFWAKVNKDTGIFPSKSNPEIYGHVKGQCWDWTASKTSDGYGRFRIKNTEQKWFSINTNRFVLAIKEGMLGSTDFACHHCDRRICVNPDHIYKGNITLNTYDRHKRGRDARLIGENHGYAKLTEQDAHKIISLYNNGYSAYRIHKMYNISATQVRRILSGESWSHLNIKASRPPRNGNTKWSDEELLDAIKRIILNGTSKEEIIKDLDINRSHLNSILQGKCRPHILQSFQALIDSRSQLLDASEPFSQ